MLSGPRSLGPVAVFISGEGSTLQALLEMHHQIPISLVVTNKLNKRGYLKAKRFGKEVFYFDKNMSFLQLHQALKDRKIERIILAGFMKLLPPDFVEFWQNKIFNIHPSLLPKYPGLNSAERSFSENSAMGVSIHNVTAQMDDGEIFLQQRSLEQPQALSLEEARLFLRRTEQSLLRELAVRYF